MTITNFRGELCWRMLDSLDSSVQLSTEHAHTWILTLISVYKTTRAGCKLAQKIVSSMRTVCEPWQTYTPQHAYRSVTENIEHRTIYLLCFVVCNVLCSTCVLALCKFSAELSGYNDSTHRLMTQRTAWDDCNVLEHVWAKTIWFYCIPCCCGGWNLAYHPSLYLSCLWK